MTSLPHHDVSLYELALSSDRPPYSLEISPTIFKTMVQSFVDLLIEQQVSATVWVKLPKGEVWQEELERYRNALIAPCTLYVLSGSKEGEVDSIPITAHAGPTEPVTLPQDMDDPPTLLEFPPEGAPAEPAPETLPSLLSSSRSGHDTSPLAYLPLNVGQQLRREYFILVLSPDFSGLLLAHRPRSRAFRQDSRTGAAPEELERKHPLLVFCSFEAPIIRQAVEGIYQAIAHTPHRDVLLDMKELLDNWDNLTALEICQSLNPRMLSDLFTRQIRNLEEVWHSSAAFRRQAEQSSVLQMRAEELQNSVRLKDEFLKNVGQELRTPLSTMKTALKLLNSPNLRPGQRQRYMEMLEQECDRQSSLITSVLDLIQLEQMEATAVQTPPQPLRIADVVPGVVSTYQPLAQEKGILLAYTVSENLPTVACSAQALRQVVINLLHNGIKFTSSGGRVWVRTRQQGDYVQLEVEDTGIGIAPADLPRIFERFYRVRHSGDDASGVGLGLSIVQQLLLRVGGSITVRSVPGEGATFTVLLPTFSKS